MLELKLIHVSQRDPGINGVLVKSNDILRLQKKHKTHLSVVRKQNKSEPHYNMVFNMLYVAL